MSTEEKILKASLELFSKYGYTGVTTKKIAEKSGVNEVTIFRKFENKNNLFQQVISNFAKEGNIIEYLESELKNSFEEDLMSFGKIFYMFLENNEMFYKLQVKQVDEKTTKFTNTLKYKQYFQEYLEKKSQEGKFLGEPKVTSALLISTVMGLFTLKVFNPLVIEGLEVEELVEKEVKKIILENNIRKF